MRPGFSIFVKLVDALSKALHKQVTELVAEGIPEDIMARAIIVEAWAFNIEVYGYERTKKTFEALIEAADTTKESKESTHH